MFSFINTLLSAAAIVLIAVYGRALLKQGSTVNEALEKLRTEVAESRTVTRSAVALLGGLKTRLDEAIAANQNGDPSQLEALSASLDQDQSDLAAAIVANTPAEAIADETTDGSTQG